MGIMELRSELSGKVPGSDRLTMSYEDGGKVQVFSIEELSVRVGPMATVSEIEAAFKDAMNGK